MNQAKIKKAIELANLEVSNYSKEDLEQYFLDRRTEELAREHSLITLNNKVFLQQTLKGLADET